VSATLSVPPRTSVAHRSTSARFSLQRAFAAHAWARPPPGSSSTRERACLVLAAALAAPGVWWCRRQRAESRRARLDRGGRGGTLPRALQRAGSMPCPPATGGGRSRRWGSPAGGHRATSAGWPRRCLRGGFLFGSWDLGEGSWPDASAISTCPRPSFALRSSRRAPSKSFGRLVPSWRRSWQGARRLRRGRARQAFHSPPCELLARLVARDPESRIRVCARLALHPGYPEAALALARLLHDASRFAEARDVLSGLGPEPPFERERHFLDGACCCGLGRPPRPTSSTRARRVRATAPACSPIERSRAARCGRPDGASTLLRQALDKAPFARSFRSASAGPTSSRRFRGRRCLAARRGALRARRRAAPGSRCRGRCAARRTRTRPTSSGGRPRHSTRRSSRSAFRTRCAGWSGSCPPRPPFCSTRSARPTRSACSGALKHAAIM